MRRAHPDLAGELSYTQDCRLNPGIRESSNLHAVSQPAYKEESCCQEYACSIHGGFTRATAAGLLCMPECCVSELSMIAAADDAPPPLEVGNKDNRHAEGLH